MALSQRAVIANDLLCQSTCIRCKMSQDTLCDRVEAWMNDPGNGVRLGFIDKDSLDISKLQNTVVPDMYWRPSLRDTLSSQLCAVESAVDMLKARSSKDKELFGQLLGSVRAYYVNPAHWPVHLEDDHMHMMLAILRHAMKKCEPTVFSSKRDPLTCFGRVAEALEQAFLYRRRGLEDVSLLTSGLFTTYQMIYEYAIQLLHSKMKRKREREPIKGPGGCGSMLGEPFRGPRESRVSVEEEMKKGKPSGDEAENPSAAQGQAGAVAVTPHQCACRHVMWKFKEAHEMKSQKKRQSKARKLERIIQGNGQSRRTTKPSVPSPLGQFVETLSPKETPPQEAQFITTKQARANRQKWGGCTVL